MKIRFLTGPNKDQLFSVKKDLIFSRTAESGDIALNDPQASNPHAKIIKKGKFYYLKDMDSKNGTYLNKKSNDCFLLKEGLKFQIGSTFLQVIQGSLTSKEHWSFVIKKELEKYKTKIKNQTKNLMILQPPLILKFKSGIQKLDSWTLYYGPRQAGRSCLDLPILDPLAPDICFSLHPQKKGILFKTSYPEKVLINNKYLPEKILQPQDRITFCHTCIEIDFLKKK